MTYLYQKSKELKEQKSKALHDYLNAVATMIISYSEIRTEDLSNAKMMIADRYKVPRSIFPIGDNALQAAQMQWLSSDNISIEYKKQFQGQKRLVAEEFITNDTAVPDLNIPMIDFAKNEIIHGGFFFFSICNFIMSIFLLCKEGEHIKLSFCTLLETELCFFVYSFCTALPIAIVSLIKNYDWGAWKSAIKNILTHSKSNNDSN